MVGRLKKISCIVLFLLVIPSLAVAQISVPKLVSDGMVLQRDTEVKVWGWAQEKESVTVQFRDKRYQTTADEHGNWEVMLPAMKAGGPYKMTISAADTTISIADILVGDVWISSGQSNMELPMRRVQPLYESEIKKAESDAIRYFDVGQDYNFNQPRKDVAGGSWQKTNPQNVLNFSAVAYFFAEYINQKYDIPIGIINASVGGSPAEAWISEGTLKEKFPQHYKEAKRFADKAFADSIRRADQQRANSWYHELNSKDRGYSEGKAWYEPDIDDRDWMEMEIPGYWADDELGAKNGVVWFRKEISVPQKMTGKPVKLLFGRVVDADSVFVNGQFVGTTSYQYPPRRYQIPADVLQKGKNTIAIRVINSGGRGGFFPDKPYKLVLGDEEMSLEGTWKYQLGAEMEPLAPQTFIRWKPLGLFNGMIAPLQNFRMKGVLWYQGESNTDQPKEYRDLFSTLVQDWRRDWEQGDFPFLYVQLANFMEAKESPTESNWAMLREAQRQTLSVPNTGMAVAIDLGEWNDIHPLNKKDVGKRLALLAQEVAYGEDIISAGPMYESMEVNDDKVILSFKNVGSGLVAKGGKALYEFSIAGADCNFVWANARIDGEEVIVWSDKVDDPKVVRYAWADNPDDANLYNEEGLPASPFSTNGLQGCRE